MKCPHATPVFMALLLCACSASPSARFYTLHAQGGGESRTSAAANADRSATPGQGAAGSGATAPAPANAATMSIVIDDVLVPEIVDRQQFVLRTGPAEVRVDEFARWAEPLKQQIARVLAADLARAFPGVLISTSPQWAGQEQFFHVSVDVQTFESVQGEAVSVAALWTVRAPDGGEPRRGRTAVQEPVQAQDYEALVDAHSRALAGISADIAQAIAGLNRGPASPPRRPPS